MLDQEAKGKAAASIGSIVIRDMVCFSLTVAGAFVPVPRDKPNFIVARLATEPQFTRGAG